ncbi:NAD(P)H-binding protein [Microbacteriaceae bacterium VKM Ac-2855]|nr:NAD(P)H-binding protein [Microbacteriaceae bacterium VKM Ac-2855]
MRIAVTTPTGNVGSRVVRLLVQSGVRPVVLARDPARLGSELIELVDAVVCDQGDEHAVIAATTGVDALFWVDPPTTDADPVAGHARMGASVSAAIRANRIPRVVFLSSVGAELRGGAGEIDGLARTEQFLDASGAAVLHLRCGYFFSNLLLDVEALRNGDLTTAADIHRPMPWVDPRDVGDVVAGRLLSTDWDGREVQAVHGPEDLSFVRVAEILSEATGRPFRARHVAADALRAQLLGAGMTPEQADGVVGMSTGMLDVTPEQRRSVLTTTPSTLAGWAHSVLRPLLAETTPPS